MLIGVIGKIYIISCGDRRQRKLTLFTVVIYVVGKVQEFYCVNRRHWKNLHN